MRTFKTEAIIIKRFNVGEADRILTVFSKHAGKFSVRAKGIRRVPSRRSAHVELLNHSLLTLYEGRSIPTLTEAQSIENFQDMKDDFTKVGFAYHLCELIDGLCPDGVEHPDIFDLLHKTLVRLTQFVSDSVDHSPIEIIHEFEVQLLTILGFWKQDFALATQVNTTAFIEDILERRLRSQKIFSKLQ